MNNCAMRHSENPSAGKSTLATALTTLLRTTDQAKRLALRNGAPW